MLTEVRTQHPFHMYDAIAAQPKAFAEASLCNAQAIKHCARRMASSDRLFLVGIGTSYHAAQVGEHLARIYGNRLDARAIHAFDFALYPPHLTPKDSVIAISHRGNKHYTLEALKHARQAGCYTALIVGENASSKIVKTDTILQTVAQEKSSAHTVSYTSAIAVLISLINQISDARIGTLPLARNDLHQLSQAMLITFNTESEMVQLAYKHHQRRRIWLVGGGPDAITSQEIALKIKETSYLQAEGMSIETMLHGPFQCAEAEDLFVLIAPSSRTQERVLQLGEMAQAIGAACVVVSDRQVTLPQNGSAYQVNVPSVPEPFSVLTCLIPLQLFSYYLALERGTNPDGFRLEDPRFAQARAFVQL